MIQTAPLRTWLRDTLLTLDGVQNVRILAQTDLDEALAHFRDTRNHTVVIIPMADEIDHEYEGDIPYPLRSRVNSIFEVLIAGRRLDRLPDGSDPTLALKDAALDLLLTTAVTDQAAHCTATACEPVTIQLDENQGREAWKITLTIRPTY